MKYPLSLVFTLSLTHAAFANEMTLGGTRTLKSGIFVPQAIDKINGKDLSHDASRNLPDVMKAIPGVMVQKTAHGQGSPYIRGFTGFRTLYMIDGIRLNNSIFRSGPNEYANTVDSYAMDGLEVVKGPASVLYGSDAIGGAVLVTTSQQSLDGNKDHEARLFLRAASGEASQVARTSYGRRLSDDTAFYLGATLKDYGDIRPGAGEKPLEHTGYKESDFDLSFKQRLDNGVLTLYSQSVIQDDVWRTHKTIYGRSYKGTSVGNEKQRLKDIKRQLSYIRYKKRLQPGAISGFEATISQQRLTEERDRIKSSDKRDLQGIDVKTSGLSLQLDSMAGEHELTYGFEAYLDKVTSSKKSYDSAGTMTGEAIQGPVGDDARYQTIGLYLQDFWLLSESSSLILGMRHNHAVADVGRYQDPVSGDAKSLSETYNANTFSVKFMETLDQAQRANAYASVAQGYRAPNLSDLTRLDDSRSNFVEVPSTGLDPETFLTYELGLKLGYDDFYAQTSLYYTVIDDMIVRKPTGSTSADGEIYTEKINAGNGFIKGAELDIIYQLTPSVKVRLFHAMIESQLDDEPLSRTMPDSTFLSLKVERPMIRFSAVLTHVADAKALSPGDKLDVQRIPEDGTPGFDTLDLKFSHRLVFLNPECWVNLAVENVTDENYRIHGSGQNEVGRNGTLSLDLRF